MNGIQWEVDATLANRIQVVPGLLAAG